MAGILDYLTGNDQAASPWGALYQAPPQIDPQQQAMIDAMALGGMGVNPASLPQRSPFDVPQQAPPSAPMPAPAPSPFSGAPASPFGFAGPGSMTGINPTMMAPPQPPPVVPAAPQVAAAPSSDLSSVNRAPAPDSLVPVGNYQMPMFGEAPEQVPAQAAAAPAPAAPAAPSPAPFSFGGAGAGIGDRLMKGTQGFMGNMGAGPVGALMGGLGALITGRNTDPTAIAQEKTDKANTATERALISKGATPAEVQAANGNPALMTALVQQYYGKDKYKVQQTGEELGQKTFKLFNETDGTFKDIPGSAGSSAGGGASGLLAPGVQYDPNKSGDAYFGQFSPEVQAAAKAYMNGDVMPTGNARKDSIATLAKTVAQKYGQDIGVPVSDANYSEKRKYRTELGSTSANSAGGQAKAFNQGIDHLSSLATTLEKLDNSNGLGVPMVAGAVNSLRQGVSNEQSAISDEAKSLGQTVAGEVGKLFSGSAGGGVHEREMTRERFDTVKSRPQLAAALQATIETMQGGLSALEQRRNAVLGPDSGVELVDGATRQKITQIQGVIDRLKGGGSATPAAGAAPALPSGWSVQVH